MLLNGDIQGAIQEVRETNHLAHRRDAKDRGIYHYMAFVPPILPGIGGFIGTLESDLQAQDDRGWTPLHYAFNKGNVACIEEFLKTRRRS